MVQILSSNNISLIKKSLSYEIKNEDRIYDEYKSFFANIGFNSSLILDNSADFNYIYVKAMRTLNSQSHFTIATTIKPCKYMRQHGTTDRLKNNTIESAIPVILFAISKYTGKKLLFSSIISTFAYFFKARVIELNSFGFVKHFKLLSYVNRKNINNGDLIFCTVLMLTLFNIERISLFREEVLSYKTYMNDFVDLLNKNKEFIEEINNGYIKKANTSYKISALIKSFIENIYQFNSGEISSSFSKIEVELDYGKGE